MRVLPAGWHTETLSEVARGGLFSDGDWVESRDQDPAGGVRLTQLADVGVAVFRDRSDRWLREDQASRLGCTSLQPDDVLIARMPDPLGRACLVPLGIGRAVTVVDVAILRPARADVDPRYVMWALNSPQASAQVESMQSGTTRKRISRKNLGTVTIPVPPLDEQRRIVEILEGHLSRLDAANDYLSASAKRLRAYCAGALSSLATGADPSVALASAAVESRYGTSAKCVPGGAGAPVVRIPNLRDGIIDLTDEKRAETAEDLSALMLRAGDLLVVRTNGSKDLIGRTAVVQSGIEAAFASYLIRYRFDPTRVVPEWVHLMLDRPEARRRLEELAASSAGQYNLGLKKLDGVELPLPSIDEQQRRIETYSGVAQRAGLLSSTVEASRRRSAALRHALLAAAFSSRLTGRSSDLDLAEEMASA